jgi:hypothetical protein
LSETLLKHRRDFCGDDGKLRVGANAAASGATVDAYAGDVAVFEIETLLIFS